MRASPDEAAFAFVGAFVEELVRAGVRHVCVAPGSRSTPLALTIAAHGALRTWVHVDERSAAFFALGMARATGAPVALLCTSGTAGANFFPAVVEARYARIPLLVFTADRPPELREVGAAQTIDQARLYGAHAKWFVDVALPEATAELLRYARVTACRAVATAAATPAGPVHLNFPFREPLVPTPIAAPTGASAADALAWRGRPGGAPWVAVRDAAPVADAATVRQLAAALGDARRPLVVCGPQFDAGLAQPLGALATALGAPLLADPLSQLRRGPHDRSAVVGRYDAVLRDESVADALAPDLVLRLGAVPTSKALLQFLQRHGGARQIVVDAAGWPDPTLLLSELVHADPRRLCEALLGALPPRSAEPGWLDEWRRIDRAADGALRCHLERTAEMFEGRTAAEVAALAPAGSTLFVSSSMPVRDLDAFAAGGDRPLRVLANRGANGIDGVISTALGVAAASRDSGGGPVLLLIGDLALVHDMNGLLAARLFGLDATVVVVNNDGGGIFSFLPQAAHPEHFERLFGTPHGLGFAPLAELHGARYTLADDWETFRTAVGAGARDGGLHLVEVRSDRARNVTLHREAWRAVAAATAEGR
ncbi:MAG TPA: 2-succinyl-5-enolpyruvyl-6-hydroxy-3-cyclohexene-1-carboxylic-acid synthase [Gemmatimonadaceae bacterium]|nr:2-succinyl-5-enolpyruvyl-6-hydroxy-3-cyclohexene-1-carboxylic-acid synthase [Gemmatimonadaceae bacterium]